jgi:hypothetical protein
MYAAWILVAASAVLSAGGDVSHPDARGAVVRAFPAGEPQFFVDDYFVDNRFNEDSISAKVVQRLMPGTRSERPLMVPDTDKPWEMNAGVGYISVVFDPRIQRFRLYYQVWNPKGDGGGLPTYSICYAESADGLHWEKPLLDFVTYQGKKTNILAVGDKEAKAPTVHLAERAGALADGTPVRNLGMLPAEALRGNDYLMYYCDSGHYLATSNDGYAWDLKREKIVPNRVDCFMTVVHDDVRDEYCMFYRNKLIYHDSKDPLKRGNTRMMARIASKNLWSLWDGMPTTVLLPDEADKGRFYNMPVFNYGGVYWGFLEQFNEEPELIEVELAFSRDGFDWDRLPSRPRMIPVGEEGGWDDGMTFASDRVIEVGDEWWVYYSAYDGYHDSKERLGRLGLMRYGKERFVGIASDPSGKRSYVVTRPLVWPGGDLLINADAAGGSMKVRVTDLDRKVVNGLSWEACEALEDDAIRHKVTWDGASMARLKGTLVRLEFMFEEADLFAFLAAE